jgi:uncharacterized surface protein with fasciclin (FAS1) repeats
MKRQFLKLALAVSAAAVLAACGGDDDTPVAPAAPTKNIVELAVATPDLSTLVTAVKAAGLVATLSGPGPFTVFAPTNAAFAKLPKADLDALLANPAALADVLKYHVVTGKVLKADIPFGKPIKTLQGQEITIDTTATITDANGGKSKITATDILATNGVVHLIDTVILPKAAAPAPTKNIVELAQATPSLSILVEAVVAADLATTLSGAGPFTVFAPTDAAFAALLAELKITKPALLADKPLLTKVLTYHVVKGKVLKADIPFGTGITTLQGETITIDTSAVITDARARKSQITATDILATNGVVHLIDKVILPKP